MVTFIDPNGVATQVEVRRGDSVMRAARAAGISAILGECGGFMNCLTCHCYVSAGDGGHIPPPSSAEAELLDCLAERRPDSRLSCQIVGADGLEGAVFTLPAWQ